MAWIESHQSLARHRKLLRALHVLGTCDRHKLIGHLHALWWWALDSSDINGLLGNISAAEIAQAADWNGDQELFFAALLEAGFLDKIEAGYQLHNWYSYAGKLMEHRQLAKEQRRQGGINRMAQMTPEERQALARDAAHARWDASRMPATVPGDASKMPATVPYRTVPNLSPTPSLPKETPSLSLGKERVSPLKGGVGETLPFSKNGAGKKKIPQTVEELPIELVEALISEFAWAWDQSEVRQIIADALDHSAARKRTDVALYLRGWLRRDAEHLPPDRRANRPRDPERFKKGKYGHLVQT